MPALLLAAVIAASPSPASPAPTLLAAAPAVRQRIDSGLSKLAGRSRGQSPALEVAVAQDGRIVLDRGFGAAAANTRFPIASITKMFTAVSVLQLVQEHRVALDAKVATYLSAAPHANEITIRELLQHTSGLWNYGDAVFASGAVTKPTTPQQILDLAASHPLTSPPGTKFAYSNTGYVVLGLVVEQVTGETLAEYERQHIFAPAGMRETTFGSAPPQAPIAAGYMSASGSVAPNYDPSWLFADGNIVSTAGDLARFDIALLDGRLVSPQTFALMQANPVDTESAMGLQGLGIEMQSWRGLQLIGHHGGVPGFETQNELIPSKNLAIVVLSDAFDFATPRANRVVLTALFPKLDMPAVGEDPAVTARFRTALASLLQGKIDRSQYTPQVNAALTPALLTQSAAQMKQFGSIAKVTYLGQHAAGTETKYSYDVTFTGGQTMTWQFVLTAGGKIAGIGSAG